MGNDISKTFEPAKVWFEEAGRKIGDSAKGFANEMKNGNVIGAFDDHIMRPINKEIVKPILHEVKKVPVIGQVAGAADTLIDKTNKLTRQVLRGEEAMTGNDWLEGAMSGVTLAGSFTPVGLGLGTALTGGGFGEGMSPKELAAKKKEEEEAAQQPEEIEYYTEDEDEYEEDEYDFDYGDEGGAYEYEDEDEYEDEGGYDYYSDGGGEDYGDGDYVYDA